MEQNILRKISISVLIMFGIAISYRIWLDNFNTDKIVFAFIFLLVSWLMLFYLIIGLVIDVKTKTRVKFA